MDAIADNHLKITKLWIEIIAKFLVSQKVLRYLMENKFDMIKLFLIFLSKSHYTIKDQTIGSNPIKTKENFLLFLVKTIKMNIYKSLEIILKFDIAYVDKILQFEDNFTLIFIKIRQVNPNEIIYSKSF